MNYGTLVFDGTSPWMSILGPSSCLKNLLVSTTGTSNPNSNLLLTGNLTIESGVFNAGTRTITIGGNWSTTVGLAAFNEGTSRVIFNGSDGHQYCSYSETFNVAKTVDSGTVTFVEPHLEFSGPAFEQDPYARIVWLDELPPVDDLVITYDPVSDTVTLSWNWNHLIPVVGFSIYRHTEPDFPIDDNYHAGSVPGAEHQFSEPVYGPRYFYKVTAYLY